MIGRMERGDVVLTSDSHFPAWQLAPALLGSRCYSHAAVYDGDGRIVEATTFHPSGGGVAHTAVENFLSGHKKVCVLRPAWPADGRVAAENWLRAQLGKPYDYGFGADMSEAMYCAGLAARALDAVDIHMTTRRLLYRELYLSDAFLCVGGIRVVCRTPPAFLAANSLPLAPAVLP